MARKGNSTGPRLEEICRRAVAVELPAMYVAPGRRV